MVVALAYGAYVEFSPSKIRQRDPAAEAAATRAEDARRPKHPDVLLQVAVSKVSIDAGLAMISPYLSYAMDDPAPCLMAKHIDRGVALGGDPIVIKMAADFHAECQFVELTRALMHPVFETIAASGALPTDLYAFQVFPWPRVVTRRPFRRRQALHDRTGRSFRPRLRHEGVRPLAPTVLDSRHQRDWFRGASSTR